MSAIITGVGSISPFGTTRAEIINALKQETVCTRAHVSDNKWVKATATAPCVSDTNALAPDVPRSLRNDALNLCWVAVHEALADAGLSPEIFSEPPYSRRVALITTHGTTGLDSFGRLLNGEERPSPFDLLKSLPTAVSGPLSTLLKVNGPVHTVQHACASGLRAIAQAMDLIELGHIDMAVCVGAEKIYDETLRGFDGMKATYRGDVPESSSLPFSAEREGLVMGEGAGCVVIEKRDRSGVGKYSGRVGYGRCLTYADYSDGHDVSAPSGSGAKASMAEVLGVFKALNITPDFISAHATSTPKGDAVEAEVIHDLVGDTIPVVALKRLIGHGITASGLIETILCLYMMQEDFIVSNSTYPMDPLMKSIYLPKSQIHKPVQSFVKNAFGFGGLNCVLWVAKNA
jgi:3-oxoacyl-(acyl-carrier-protein) synthase